MISSKPSIVPRQTKAPFLNTMKPSGQPATPKSAPAASFGPLTSQPMTATVIPGAACGGSISFSQAWRFGVLLYFFAALIVSVMHYIFYRFVAPPDYMANAVSQTIESLKQMQVESQVIQSIETLNFSPIHLALQGILNNILYGIIFSIPVAGLLCRKKSPGVQQN